MGEVEKPVAVPEQKFPNTKSGRQAAAAARKAAAVAHAAMEKFQPPKREEESKPPVSPAAAATTTTTTTAAAETPTEYVVGKVCAEPESLKKKGSFALQVDISAVDGPVDLVVSTFSAESMPKEGDLVVIVPEDVAGPDGKVVKRGKVGGSWNCGLLLSKFDALGGGNLDWKKEPIVIPADGCFGGPSSNLEIGKRFVRPAGCIQAALATAGKDQEGEEGGEEGEEPAAEEKEEGVESVSASVADSSSKQNTPRGEGKNTDNSGTKMGAAAKKKAKKAAEAAAAAAAEEAPAKKLDEDEGWSSDDGGKKRGSKRRGKK